MTKDTANLESIGYLTVRKTFNALLQVCSEKLTKPELKHAYAALNLDYLDADSAGDAEMLVDTAIFSARPGKKRAVDRIAPKLAANRDPLTTLIAARLPSASFSLFAIKGMQGDGCVKAHDLLDNARSILIMDQALAAQAALHRDLVIAGRYLDLGPWHIGFGIVTPLPKSEVVAIMLSLSAAGNSPEARGSLHELIYTVNIHGLDLVMMALGPLISALASDIDTGTLDAAKLVAMADTLFPNGLAGIQSGHGLPA